MRNQVETLEEERRRRVRMQIAAEERADKLQIELDQLKQKANEQTQSEQLIDNNTGETASVETNSSIPEGVDHCRNLVILRNKYDQDFLPPPLVALKENIELKGVDEDKVPRMNPNELRNSWLTQSTMELPVL